MLGDVAKDFGDDFNPFELHRRTVISLEMLIARPHLTEGSGFYRENRSSVGSFFDPMSLELIVRAKNVAIPKLPEHQTSDR